MKRLIISIVISTLLFSCSPDNMATVKIHLSTPGQTAAIHSYIDRILMLFSTPAFAQQVPQDIYRFRVSVSGPDMPDVQWEFEPSETEAVISVPAGKSRLIEVFADVTSGSATAVYSFRGHETMDLAPGEIKEASIHMAPYNTKILVPDNWNSRLFQVNGLSMDNQVIINAGNIGFPGSFKPNDIDFDARGRIYIANYGFSTGEDVVIRIDNINSTSYTEVANAGGSAVISLAIDKIRNILYFATSLDRLRKHDLTTGTTTEYTTFTSFTSIQGIAVDDDGIVYLAGDTGAASSVYSVIKFNPVTATVEKQYGVTSGDTPLDDPWDVFVKDGTVYVANRNGAAGYKIIALNTDLELIGNFGNQATTGASTQPGTGEFFGPRRFLGIRPDNLVLLDEYYNDDALISFKDIQGTDHNVFYYSTAMEFFQC